MRLALLIVKLLFRLIMNIAVHLNDQPVADAGKVCDKAFNGMLTAKLCAANLSIA